MRDVVAGVPCIKRERAIEGNSPRPGMVNTFLNCWSESERSSRTQHACKPSRKSGSLYRPYAGHPAVGPFALVIGLRHGRLLGKGRERAVTIDVAMGRWWTTCRTVQPPGR